jgi:hypothetical protein
MRLQDRGIEDFTVRSAEHPCPVERGVGIAQHVLGLCVPSGAHGHADARRQKDFTAVDRERSEDFREQAIGDDLCVADGLQAVEQHGELVGFDARHEVVAAQRGIDIRDAKARFQAPRGGGEERSRRMSAEVEQQQRVMESRIFLRALDRVRQTIDEEQPIGQRRELVGDGLDRDVGVRARQAHSRSAAVAHG